MDSVTQAVLGASIAGAVAGKTLGRSTLALGAALGTLPDLDVLIDYGTAIANFTQHRGFSHSLFVLAPLSVLLAYGLWRWQPKLSLARWLCLVALILITHPLLDAMTTYGTQLFWPIGDPVALNSVFIIDPLYTLPLLLACLIFAFRPPARSALLTGLAVSTLYLGWSLAAQQAINTRVQTALAAAGIEPEKLLVQPMPFSTILWRATALTPDTRIEIVTGFLDGDAPLTLERFARNPALRQQVAGLPEVQRLEWFTDGFLQYQSEDNTVVATDIRLGVPGGHPFRFVVAQADDTRGITPLASLQLSRPPLKPDAPAILWARLTGQAPTLCLANLSIPGPGEGC